MSRLPPAAHVQLRPDGALHAPDFDDTYFSTDGGLDETRSVFLAGCALPERWLNRQVFTIAELGFGTGLNLLASWDLWRRTRSPGAVLHFVTLEGFLLDAPDAAAVHARAAPELAALSQRLIARWPVRCHGLQRVWFAEDGLCLTVLVGEAQAILPRLALAADSWFLDGFAPARNPLMWSPQVLEQVARLSAPGARAATYSVAGSVRRGLEAAGFAVSRAPGFGRKRERLEAVWPEKQEQSPGRVSRTALIIGGGIAGAALARAFALRGLAVTVLDSDPCGRTKASGNPRALVMPRLDRDETREGRFHRAAFVQAAQILHQLGPPAFEPTGVIEIPKSARDSARAAELLADPPLPSDWLFDDGTGRMRHGRGGVLAPVDVVSGLLEGVQTIPRAVARIDHDDGRWRALDSDGTVLAAADLAVIAAGPASAALLEGSGPPMPLEARHGVISIAPLQQGAPPEVPLAGGAYAGPMEPGGLFFGATFDPWELTAPPQTPGANDHRRNQALLAGVAPELASGLDMEGAWGRASVRTTTPDRMPVAGAIAGQSGLGVLTGLGARGFTTAFLCAELIASQLLGEPLPVDADVAEALAPERFARRAARRAGG